MLPFFARLPNKTANPPLWEYGLSSFLITSLSDILASAIFSPSVLPVTVILLVSNNSSPFDNSFKIAEIPPALATSSMCTSGLAGLTLHIFGVLFYILLISSKSISKPASLTIAKV